MHVAVVTVGDELLVGDTVNTNAARLGERLTARGATVERVTVLPDREADIVRTVDEYSTEYDAVVVTGGLCPTHDDVTMAGVAAAFDRSMEPNREVLERLTTEGGYARDDLAAGTTSLPSGAQPLHNAESVAPGCVVENVYVLSGVPDEMKAVFETVEAAFEGRRRHVDSVEIDEPERALLDRFETLRAQFEVTVGSYPGETVRVKIESTDEAAVAWLKENAETISGTGTEASRR